LDSGVLGVGVCRRAELRHVYGVVGGFLLEALDLRHLRVEGLDRVVVEGMVVGVVG